MIKPDLKHFNFSHLPPYLQEVSKPFHVLAHDMDKLELNETEKAIGLRKLLEAKDCMVRGFVYTKPE